MAEVRGPSRPAPEPPPRRAPKIRSHLGMALLALSAVFFGVNFAHEWVTSHRIEAQTASLQARIAQQNAYNKYLQSQLATYSSQDYIMQQARAQFGMAQPQDALVRVVELPPRVKVVRVRVPAPAPRESIFVHLLRAIFQ